MLHCPRSGFLAALAFITLISATTLAPAAHSTLLECNLLWCRLGEAGPSNYAHCAAVFEGVLYVAGSRGVLADTGLKHYLRVEAIDTDTGAVINSWESEALVLGLGCSVDGYTLYVAGTLMHPNRGAPVGFIHSFTLDLTPLQRVLMEEGEESFVLGVEAAGERVYVAKRVRVGENSSYFLELRDSDNLSLLKRVEIPYQPTALRVNRLTGELWVIGFNETTIMSPELSPRSKLGVGGVQVGFDNKGRAYILNSNRILVVLGPPVSLVVGYVNATEGGEFLGLCYSPGYVVVVSRRAAPQAADLYEHYVEVYSEDITPICLKPVEVSGELRVGVEPGGIACGKRGFYIAGWHRLDQLVGWAIQAHELPAPPGSGLSGNTTLGVNATNTGTPQPSVVVATPQEPGSQDKAAPKYTPPLWWLSAAVALAAFAVIAVPLLLGKRH